MKAETCRALLTDRELGELASETAELLDAYLALDPAAASEAENWSEVTALARRAVAVPLEVPQRTFVSELRRATMIVQFRRWAWASARLAATVAVGIGIGWWWFARSAIPSPTPAAIPLVSPLETNDAPPRFWSRENFVSEAHGRPASQRRLAWSSPVRKPQLEANP